MSRESVERWTMKILASSASDDVESRVFYQYSSVLNVMTSSPTSLRDLYSAQQRDSPWSFTPPPINATVAQPVPVTPQFKWTTRPAQNSIFDLSPDLNEASGINAVDLLRTIGASAVLQYTSTAIAMPWEVGKLLLQVQWIPRDADANSVEEVEDDDSVGSLFYSKHSFI